MCTFDYVEAKAEKRSNNININIKLMQICSFFLYTYIYCANTQVWVRLCECVEMNTRLGRNKCFFYIHTKIKQTEKKNSIKRILIKSRNICWLKTSFCICKSPIICFFIIFNMYEHLNIDTCKLRGELPYSICK